MISVTNRSDLESVVNTMLNYVFSKQCSEPDAGSQQEIAQIFLNAVNFNKHDGHAESSMTFDDFKTWCTLLPSVKKFLGSLMDPSDPGCRIFLEII